MTSTKDVITRTEAKKLMWEYYRDNKSSLPKWIVECREAVLEHMMAGHHIELAFDVVLAANSYGIKPLWPKTLCRPLSSSTSIKY